MFNIFNLTILPRRNLEIHVVILEGYRDEYHNLNVDTFLQIRLNHQDKDPVRLTTEKG